MLALNTLWKPIQAISYLLPVTLGSLDLRDVMLRGAIPDVASLTGLAIIGVVCYTFASMELSRRMATQ